MASAFFANADSASPISEKNLMIGGWCAIALLVTACGFAEVSVNRLNFNASKAKSDQLAVVHFNYDEDETTAPYDLELVRVRGVDKGYALRAPLYTEEKGALHFAIAKQKETKWFFGLRGRWEF